MNLQDAYASMHAEAMTLLAQIEEKLNDLPAPDADGLNWGHVGDLGNIVHQLKGILRGTVGDLPLARRNAMRD